MKTPIRCLMKQGYFAGTEIDLYSESVPTVRAFLSIDNLWLNTEGGELIPLRRYDCFEKVDKDPK